MAPAVTHSAEAANPAKRGSCGSPITAHSSIAARPPTLEARAHGGESSPGLSTASTNGKKVPAPRSPMLMKLHSRIIEPEPPMPESAATIIINICLLYTSDAADE